MKKKYLIPSLLVASVGLAVVTVSTFDLKGKEKENVIYEVHKTDFDQIVKNSKGHSAYVIYCE